MKKRSVKIQGHATSISLEEEFWTLLREIASREKMTVSALLAQIDRKRARQNLSSAIRVYILKDLQTRLADTQN